MVSICNCVEAQPKVLLPMPSIILIPKLHTHSKQCKQQFPASGQPQTPAPQQEKKRSWFEWLWPF